MKRMLAACLLLCALPVWASAAKIDFNLELNGGKMVVFDAVSDILFNAHNLPPDFN